MFKKLPRLIYPTRWRETGGNKIEEYIIPEEEKGRVLDELYPFEPVPDLGDSMFDLHEEKEFQVREFRVLRGEAMDLLVSPYYFSSGGTVIDWMPASFKAGGTLERKIRGESLSILTVSLGPKAACH